MNKMRTPEEKEIIVKDYLNGTEISQIETKYDVDNRQVYSWSRKGIPYYIQQ
ncbi:MAG: helix-turn-helix domain-containing protein [Bacilli bacterium]